MAAYGSRTVAAILVAAGDGVRLGRAEPKAFVTVHGRTLLEHAVRPFRANPGIRDVVVVAPGGSLARAAALLDDGVTTVAGGPTRQASVAFGLAALAADVDTVLVHDVARPFAPAGVLDRVLAALVDGADAVVPGRPVIDTIKRVDDDGAVVETLDRSGLWAVQTPQGFRRSVLEAAHASGVGRGLTDDAGLVEADGGRVVVVDGADEAFKITRPGDLIRAAAVAPRS
jgi:2-C-methyl-D-erythritol 4-phosphate cytidylyltransferase